MYLPSLTSTFIWLAQVSASMKLTLFSRPQTGTDVQGYLAHKKERPPGTLQWEYAEGPMVVIGGGAVSYEWGTPVPHNHPPLQPCDCLRADCLGADWFTADCFSTEMTVLRADWRRTEMTVLKLTGWGPRESFPFLRHKDRLIFNSA